LNRKIHTAHNLNERLSKRGALELMGRMLG